MIPAAARSPTHTHSGALVWAGVRACQLELQRGPRGLS